MAITRTRRLTRYNRLTNAGFTRGEALRFSRVLLNSPYLQRMIRERRELVANARQEGLTDKEITQRIAKIYVDRGWIKEDILGRVSVDYWEYLRYEIQRSKDRGEEYESPAMLKVKKRRGTRKVNREGARRARARENDKGDQKYPTGGHYKR